MEKGFNEFMEQYMAEAEFREQLQTNFDDAISGYSFTPDEKQQLREHIERVAPKIRGYASRVFDEIVDKYGRQ